MTAVYVQPAPREAMMDLGQGHADLRPIELGGEQKDELIVVTALIRRLLHSVPARLSARSEPQAQLTAVQSNCPVVAQHADGYILTEEALGTKGTQGQQVKTCRRDRRCWPLPKAAARRSWAVF